MGREAIQDIWRWGRRANLFLPDWTSCWPPCQEQMEEGNGGGAAVDPKTGVLYVNANETPRISGLIIPPPPESEGERVYQQRCSACHGLNRGGSPPDIPSLVGIDHRITDQGIEDVVRQGKGRMPPFSDINEAQFKSLIRYSEGSTDIK